MKYSWQSVDLTVVKLNVNDKTIVQQTLSVELMYMYVEFWQQWD